MLTEKESKRISKFLSLVLRHKPDQIGLQLDQHGWANVDSLIEQCNQFNIPLTMDVLKHIVKTNAKKRFVFDEQQQKIRANQGHSITVELGLIPQTPPAILFHGTTERFVASILKTGLTKQQRQQVHLSAELETAISVGRRHGKPYIFEVLAQQMFDNNYQFFLSENGVWLTDHVPVIYLKQYLAGDN